MLILLIILAIFNDLGKDVGIYCISFRLNLML